jgi:hypothetical protein
MIRFALLVAMLCISGLSFADEPTIPGILSKPTAAKESPATEAAVEAKAPWESDRDDEWEADVEEALRWLYVQQNQLNERVDALEKAMIQVRTASGSSVRRTVQMANGVGSFQLAPGETLTAYQDASGKWINVNESQSRVVSHINSQPVRSYTSPPVMVPRYQAPIQTDLRTYSTFQSPMRGAIRYSQCSGGSCR